MKHYHNSSMYTLTHFNGHMHAHAHTKNWNGGGKPQKADTTVHIILLCKACNDKPKMAEHRMLTHIVRNSRRKLKETVRLQAQLCPEDENTLMDTD